MLKNPRSARLRQFLATVLHDGSPVIPAGNGQGLPATGPEREVAP
jgi:hypothetical protein